jgi:hypothetical protein
MNTKFHENPSSGSRVVSCGRTDRRTTDMSKLIVAFRTFANALKNSYVFLASNEAGLEINAEKRTLSSFPVVEWSTESQPKAG